MARRVDEVELIGLPIVCRVHNADGIRLDGDAALALDVHGVEQLSLHIAFLDGVRELEDAVRYGGLAVVDVRNDGEVADVRGICRIHERHCTGFACIMARHCQPLHPFPHDTPAKKKPATRAGFTSNGVKML